MEINQDLEFRIQYWLISQHPKQWQVELSLRAVKCKLDWRASSATATQYA